MIIECQLLTSLLWAVAFPFVIETYRAEDLAVGFMAGVFDLIGGILLNVAIGSGPGGPVQALIMTQCIYHGLLSFFFLDQYIAKMQAIGMILGLQGICIIYMNESKAKDTKKVKKDDDED